MNLSHALGFLTSFKCNQYTGVCVRVWGGGGGGGGSGWGVKVDVN